MGIPTDANATVERVKKMVFSVRSVSICCKQNSWSNDLVVVRSPVGKNLSTEAHGIVEICHWATIGEDTAG
jgi:hypothetical protein